MNDPQHPDSPEEESVPEGMEKRVRRVRKRKKNEGGKGGTKSLLDRGKDLLEKMEQNEELGHVGVAEQVRRLQKDEDEDKPLDEIWGSKRRSTSWLWVSLLGIILPLVAIGIGLKLFNQEKVSNFINDEEFHIEMEIEEDTVMTEGPLAWFHKDSIKYIRDAQKILKIVNTATTAEEIEPYLRPSPYRKDNPVNPKFWSSPAQVGNINDITWESSAIKMPDASEDRARGVLAIKGRRKDQSKFTAYFVKEGHEFFLDWDATTGWSEMSMLDLRAYQPREPKEIRCVLEKKAIFDRKFGGVEHSGYVLAEPETGDFIFAYVPLVDEKRKEMDKQLREVLQYGRFVMALKHDEPIVVKVRAIEGGRFEIVDFKHEGWVNPELSVSALPASR